MTDSDILERLNELAAYTMQQLDRFSNIFMLAVCYQICNIAILWSSSLDLKPVAKQHDPWAMILLWLTKVNMLCWGVLERHLLASHSDTDHWW